MDADPYDAWYHRQLLTTDSMYHSANWNYFTINHDAHHTSTAVKKRKVELGAIGQWLEAQSEKRVPGLDILFAQHKNCTIRNQPKPCPPFMAAQFHDAIRALRLSPQYFHIRGKAGCHSCAFNLQTYTDDQGHVTGISTTLRMGFASRRSCGCVWAYALSWNAMTGRTTAFIEGFSDLDVEELIFLLNANFETLNHPLTLAEILLHMLTSQLNEHSRVPVEEAFYREEERTGLSSLPSGVNTEWTLGFDDFKHITGTANKSLTRMVFLMRRFRLLVCYARRLHSVLGEFKDARFEDPGISAIIMKGYHQRSQRLLNRIEMLGTYEHQTECMQKRVGNLSTRLETVLSQINNQRQAEIATTNLSIARAVRSDSIPMRTIAYVTLLLLPGALISSIFGMNFFQYDETNGLKVAKTFWQYWAITVPVTLLVIGVWNVWNYNEKKKDVTDELVTGSGVAG